MNENTVWNDSQAYDFQMTMRLHETLPPMGWIRSKTDTNPQIGKYNPKNKLFSCSLPRFSTFLNDP